MIYKLLEGVKLRLLREVFNDREIAIGIWIAIGLIIILSKKNARHEIRNIVFVLLNKKMMILYGVFICILGLILTLLSLIGFWDSTLLKDTVFWVLFVEVPLFARAIEKADSEHFFSELIRENITAAVFIEFFVGFWTFELAIEIILVPVVVVVSAIYIWIDTSRRNLPLKRMLDKLRIPWGMILLLNSLFGLILNPMSFFNLDILKAFLLPFILLIFNLPVVYGLALYNNYEQVFLRIHGSKRDQKNMRRQIILFSGISLSKLSAVRRNLLSSELYYQSSADLRVYLDKLSNRFDLQIGENYMKQSHYYVAICIIGFILSLIGIIWVNSDLSFKDLIEFRFELDLLRIKEILTYIFSTMLASSIVLLFFAIGFSKKKREEITVIKKYALSELLLSIKIQRSQMKDESPIGHPTELFYTYVINSYRVLDSCNRALAGYENLFAIWELETVKSLKYSASNLTNSFGININNATEYTENDFCEYYKNKVKEEQKNNGFNIFTHIIEKDIEKYKNDIEKFFEDFKYYY